MFFLDYLLEKLKKYKEQCQNNNNEVEELDLNHLMQIRRDKLKDLKEEGKDPYEITKFNRTNTAGEIKANYEKFEEKDCVTYVKDRKYVDLPSPEHLFS
jgi:lysyl-tRNA synthetase class II